MRLHRVLCIVLMGLILTPVAWAQSRRNPPRPRLPPPRTPATVASTPPPPRPNPPTPPTASPPPSPSPPSPPPVPIPPSPFANPLGPSICPPPGGGAYTVSSKANGGGPLYPGTPHVLTPFVDAYVKPSILSPRTKTCRTAPDPHCIASFEVDIVEFQARAFDGAVPACKGLPGTWMLGYNGEVPGPTIVAPAGHESLVRFNQKVAGVRFGASPALCPAAQGKSGRAFVVHHHGGASLAPFDGWAEDVICGNESKDYVYGENRPITGWYHDHGLHLTSENVYHGLKGFYYGSAKVKEGGCGEPYNLENVEELPMMLADEVLDVQCQLYADLTGVHKDDLYGDINTVNGVPFPRMRLDAKWYRLRLLNASPARPYLLRIKDAAGADVSSRACQIIAKDGGFRPSPVAFPAAGLVIGVGERYEVVCDFSAQAGKTLWLWNEKDAVQFKEEVPYFCYSHLIAKIEVGAAPASPAPAFNPAARPPPSLIPINVVLTPADVSAAQAMANAGRFHREFDFGRTGGQWTINGLTWESAKVSAANVGQNTWEVWKFYTGGGWFHPLHIHLVDAFILRRVGGGGLKSYEANSSPADMIFLGPGQDVYALVRFGPHRGDYMFHCHNTVHEDDDMMVDYRIVATSAGRNDTKASADRFIKNPLYGIVYDTFQYADPMYPNTRARPTASMPALGTATADALAANLYRIFFPTAADKAAYAGYENPWQVTVCPY